MGGDGRQYEMGGDGSRRWVVAATSVRVVSAAQVRVALAV